MAERGATPRRATHRREDFVAAGLEFVKQHGVADLTARSLAEHMGVNHTAMYRHFSNMGELQQALVDSFFLEMTVPGPLGDTARARLEALIVGVRRTFVKYPQLGLLVASGSGDAPTGLELIRTVLDLLADLGLEGDWLVVGYQSLESHLIGVDLYDHLGAPDHLEIRRARYRLVDHPALDRAVPSVGDVARINDAAFALGVAAILDRLEALAEHT
jgi:TetR/AcrR family tetracycline transcriptional repressor